MFAPARERLMGRPKKRKDGKSPTGSAKIDLTLLNRAKMIAKDKNTDLSVYLSDLVRDSVNRDWASLVRKLEAEGTGEEEDPPPKK